MFKNIIIAILFTALAIMTFQYHSRVEDFETKSLQANSAFDKSAVKVERLADYIRQCAQWNLADGPIQRLPADGGHCTETFLDLAEDYPGIFNAPHLKSPALDGLTEGR